MSPGEGTTKTEPTYGELTDVTNLENPGVDPDTHRIYTVLAASRPRETIHIAAARILCT
jgi:hypothetical protein